MQLKLQCKVKRIGNVEMVEREWVVCLWRSLDYYFGQGRDADEAVSIKVGVRRAPYCSCVDFGQGDSIFSLITKVPS